MAEQTTQIVREAPEIEAIKLALLEDARELSKEGRVIPPQLVADMSGLQVTAAELAAAGIGGYQPYLQEAGYVLGDAQTAIGDVMQTASPFQREAADALRGGIAGISPQIAAAQQGIAGGIDYGALAAGDARGGLISSANLARGQAGLGAQDMRLAGARIPAVFGGTQQGVGDALSFAEMAAQQASDPRVTSDLASDLSVADQGARQ